MQRLAGWQHQTRHATGAAMPSVDDRLEREPCKPLPSGLPLDPADAGGAEPENPGASRRRDNRDPGEIAPPVERIGERAPETVRGTWPI
jgi:hypothetical protein